MSIEKLKDAVLTIKTECDKRNGDCAGCPLAQPNEYNCCAIVGDVSAGSGDYKKMPKYWKIVPQVRIFS